MDAITAFLQGNLDEDIYMQQPEGYEDGTNRVCRLNKAVYGLKQAGRQWNIKLDDVLQKHGLIKSKLDPCIYFSKELNLIVAIYVDDFLIFYRDGDALDGLQRCLNTAFKMKDIGPATSCLGIRIDQQDGQITLDQISYIKEILIRFRMDECKEVGTPSDTNAKLSINMKSDADDEEELKRIPYQEAVGSLLYLAQCTRPDIAFAVNDVSRFNSNYGNAHWNAVKRIIRCLRATINLKLHFIYEPGEEIMAYTDSDWASDVDKRRS